MKKTIAIVTGASSGMGREFVKQLDVLNSSQLDEIWVIARRKDRLLDLQKEIKHVTLKVVAIDLCNEQELSILDTLLQEEQPQVCYLVNAAGVGVAGPFVEASRQQAENMIALNDYALVSVTHRVIPYILPQGKIIQIASAAGFLPQVDFAVYAASKAFVLSFSKALSYELKKKKIYITVVCPGPVDTEFLHLAYNGKKRSIWKVFTTVQSRPVVKKALRDAKAKKRISIYGIPMKLLYVVGKIIPHSWILNILSR